MDYGKYALTAVMVAAGTALFIFGDPAKAEAWGQVAKEYGPGALGLLSGVLLLQQRQTQNTLKAQDEKAEQRTEKLNDVVRRVEKVSEDVNGGSIAALQVKGQEAYARGAKDTIEGLRGTIADLVAEAVHAERVRADRAAAEQAAEEARAMQAAFAAGQQNQGGTP